MCEKFSAVFKKCKGEIKVFYVHHCPEGNRSICLGTLDPASEHGYEGKFVFNLALTEPIHISGNVLGEIADYCGKGRSEVHSTLLRTRRR